MPKSEDTIPLVDGELSGTVIIPTEPFAKPENHGLRGKRTSFRKSCSQMQLCFSPQFESGRIEHVACPVIDISTSGLAVEFDQPLKEGLTGHVSYRTANHKPIRVVCRVRRCLPLGNGRYKIGLLLNRSLRAEELKMAKPGPGRDLAPGVRPRRLRDCEPTDVVPTSEEFTAEPTGGTDSVDLPPPPDEP